MVIGFVFVFVIYLRKVRRIRNKRGGNKAMDFDILIVACASPIEVDTFVAAVVGREGKKFVGKKRKNAAVVRNAVATFVAFNIAPTLTFDGSEGRSSRSSESRSESRIVISHFSSLLNNIGDGGTTKISRPSSPDIIK